MFIIEDTIHAEPLSGHFFTFNDALEHIRFISKIPWDQEPNKCPCTAWRNCERNYQIIHYDDTVNPWIELKRVDILTISAKEIKWRINL